MDVTLSDWLTCPRCGPLHGLILLPEAVRDRRVGAGVLGCANCRERYPVRDGVADLRVGASPGAGQTSGPASAEAADAGGSAEGSGGGAPGYRGGAGASEGGIRLAALLGLAEVRGTVLVAGPAVEDAGPLSSRLPDVTVVAVGDDVVEAAPSGGGAAGEPSWLRVDGAIPFRNGSMAGVALTGTEVGLAAEGLRVLRRPGRLLLDPAPAGVREWLEERGAEVLIEEGGVVVAVAGE